VRATIGLGLSLPLRHSAAPADLSHGSAPPSVFRQRQHHTRRHTASRVALAGRSPDLAWDLTTGRDPGFTP